MTIKIESLDHHGRGIAYINGKVIFIPNVLPNEEVEIRILSDKKRYALGEVINYEKTSKQRINALCPYYEQCGGCHLSHISYQEQLDYKKTTLINIIKKYSDLMIKPQIIASNQEYYYRNKVTLKIKDHRWGYYHENSHQFIPISKCILAKEVINKIIANQKLFNINNGEIIIRTNYNNEILISINSSDEINIDINKLTKDNKIVGIIINDKIYYGAASFMERINKLIYQVSYNSFFQVNLDILSKVFTILRKEKYQNVLDLYCGVGTLGLAINKDKLYGIEIVSSAIQNALINNKINRQNNLFILGDSSKVKEITDKINTIIIDPPRSGIGKITLNYIMDLLPEKVIYMSCDPLTLARDLNILKKKYQLDKIFLIDMFPQTYHIETLCFLSLK